MVFIKKFNHLKNREENKNKKKYRHNKKHHKILTEKIKCYFEFYLLIIVKNNIFKNMNLIYNLI